MQFIKSTEFFKINLSLFSITFLDAEGGFAEDGTENDKVKDKKKKVYEPNFHCYL